MLSDLARRGDLAVVRWEHVGTVGLVRYRDGAPGMTGALTREEWRWLVVCGVPVALRELGSELTVPVESEQTSLAVEA